MTAAALSDRATPPTAELRRRAAGAVLLAVLAASLLLAVPGLRDVLRDIGHMSPVWLIAGVALELASCISFVVIFRLFFDRLRARDARSLAWTSMASGVLLPGGGAGGLAIGGWLMRLTGVPTTWIIRRSSGLFWFTSGVNAVAVMGAGLLLLAGAGEPGDMAHAGLPVLVVATALVVVLASPRLVQRRRDGSRRHAIDDLLEGIRDAWRALLRPSWRLLGAAGYLGFDIAVLWTTLRALGDTPPAAALVLGYTIGYLANALPVPGGLGVLDGGLAAALLLYGAPAGHVAAAVLVYHAIALWLPGLGGLLAYARLRRRLALADATLATQTDRIPALEGASP